MCGWKEGTDSFAKTCFQSHSRKENCLTSHVVHTVPILACPCVSVCVRVLCVEAEAHLYINADHSDRLKMLGSAGGQHGIIPEAPFAGGKQGRCSHPQSLHHSVGWSCTVTCTPGSTGSAWAAAGTFHRSPQTWSGAHMNRSRRLQRQERVIVALWYFHHQHHHHRIMSGSDRNRTVAVLKRVKEKAFRLVTPCGQLGVLQDVTGTENEGLEWRRYNEAEINLFSRKNEKKIASVFQITSVLNT